MTKNELARLLSKKGVCNSKAEGIRILNVILETIQEVLKSGENISFNGWGKFEVIERAKRIGRNPKTGEEIEIAAKNSVKFKVGKLLEKTINKN